MNGYLPQKELVFFIPGKAGSVLIHPAGNYITVEQLIHTQARLVKNNNHPVIYIEDRRMKPR